MEILLTPLKVVKYWMPSHFKIDVKKQIVLQNLNYIALSQMIRKFCRWFSLEVQLEYTRIWISENMNHCIFFVEYALSTCLLKADPYLTPQTYSKLHSSVLAFHYTTNFAWTMQFYLMEIVQNRMLCIFSHKK